MTATLLSTWRFTKRQLDALAEAAPQYEVRQQTAVNPAGVDAALAQYPRTEILYTGSAPSLRDRPDPLRWIQLHSAGLEAMQGAPVWDWPVPITSGSGITSVAVAELAFTGILMLRRRLVELVDLQRARRWPLDRLGLAGNELYGSTALLVGYGSVGRAIGRLLHAARVRLIVAVPDPARRVYDGYTAADSGDPHGHLPSAWYATADLHALLPTADLVVLCRPPAASAVIGAPELSLMRSDALLVNVGRGALVDVDAMARALDEERIAGAFLDVTDPEPLPADSPLWSNPRCLITPHLAGTTIQAGEHALDLLTTNLARWLGGQPLLNRVSGRGL